MKNNLKTLLRARLRSVGMEANDSQMARLLDHVVEKLGVVAFLQKMTAEQVFTAARPVEKDANK